MKIARQKVLSWTGPEAWPATGLEILCFFRCVQFLHQNVFLSHLLTLVFQTLILSIFVNFIWLITSLKVD